MPVYVAQRWKFNPVFPGVFPTKGASYQVGNILIIKNQWFWIPQFFSVKKVVFFVYLLSPKRKRFWINGVLICIMVYCWDMTTFVQQTHIKSVITGFKWFLFHDLVSFWSINNTSPTCRIYAKDAQIKLAIKGKKAFYLVRNQTLFPLLWENNSLSGIEH